MPITSAETTPGRERLGQCLIEAIESPEIAPTETPNEQPLVDALLRDATRERASDVHLEPQRDDVLLRFRIDGAMVDVAAIAKAPASRMLNQFKTLTGVDPVSLFAPEEARFSYEVDGQEIDLRVAYAPSIAGQKMTVRMLDTRHLRHDIRELGFSRSMLSHVEQWLSDVSGMFLVTGPTGSGKTTTLYALLHELRLLERSIVTLEDPVEFQIDGITQMQVDPERNLTFDEGLKSMLRLDPDFLLLGEIRDIESARTAAAAASSGHVLVSTLHCHDPVSAVTTLRNWGLADYEITPALQVVVSQRLVRRLCPHCRRQEAPHDRERRWLQSLGLEVPDMTWHPGGCDACRGLGYHGRVGIFEVWRLSGDDLERISTQQPERVLRQHLQHRDHKTLLTDGLEKASDGTTSLNELLGGRLVQGVAGRTRQEQAQGAALQE